MGTIGKDHIFMTNNRLNKKFLPQYVAENKRTKLELNPDTHGYVKHSNSDVPTTLLRIAIKGHLVVYIGL